MLGWIIQMTIISVILIFLVHHLIHFFKSTLTVPKIKDLVNKPSIQYENIYKIINHDNPVRPCTNDYTLIDLLPSQTTHTPSPQKDGVEMKTELKNFLKAQLS